MLLIYLWSMWWIWLQQKQTQNRHECLHDLSQFEHSSFLYSIEVPCWFGHWWMVSGWLCFQMFWSFCVLTARSLGSHPGHVLLGGSPGCGLCQWDSFQHEGRGAFKENATRKNGALSLGCLGIKEYEARGAWHVWDSSCAVDLHLATGNHFHSS